MFARVHNHDSHGNGARLIEPKSSSMNEAKSLVSIEQVESKLQAFQDRLMQYGKDMFGDDFAIISLMDPKGMESMQGENNEHQSSLEDNQTAPKMNARFDLSDTFGQRKPSRKEQAASRRNSKSKEGAKSVLLKFLEDREELIRLRVINKAAQEKLHDRIAHLESGLKRLQSMLRESDKRNRTEALNSQAFLVELRKKLTSVERRQSRLLALMTMPDDEHRDAVLERHLAIEQKGASVTDRKKKTKEPDVNLFTEDPKDSPGLEDTLSKLSKELQEIEMCMKAF